MTELTCWPLDNKEYTAAALGAAYAARSRGILNASDFAAKTNGDNTVTIAPGVACLHIGDYWAAFPYLAESTTLQLTDADGTLPRWDVIVLVYDKNANTAGLDVRRGTPAKSPSLPDIRRNADYDEIFLYRVTRPAGAGSIAASDLVDLRLDGSVCGLMRDTIDAVDTSVINAAFQDYLAQMDAALARLTAGTDTMLKTQYDPHETGLTFENVKTNRTDIAALQAEQVAKSKYDASGTVQAAGGIAGYVSGQVSPVTKRVTTLENMKAVFLYVSADKWSSTAPYTATVTVSGMTADWIPGAPVLLPATDNSGTIDMSMVGGYMREFAKVNMVTSGENSITFTALEEKPTWGFRVYIPGLVKK